MTESGKLHLIIRCTRMPSGCIYEGKTCSPKGAGQLCFRLARRRRSSKRWLDADLGILAPLSIGNLAKCFFLGGFMRYHRTSFSVRES